MTNAVMCFPAFLPVRPPRPCGESKPLRLFLLFLLTVTAAHGQPHCALQGVVTDKTNGDALPGARLFLKTGSSAALLLRSDRQGKFCFESVEPGDYTLQIQRAGYLDALYGKGLVLAIRAGTELAPLDVKLVRRAVLSGTVLDGDGEPVAGAEVAVYARRKSGDDDEDNEVESSPTDENGNFRFDSLSPGTYYLGASWKNPVNREFAIPFLAAGGKPQQAGYATTFYSAASRIEDAKPLLLEAGKDVAGILLTLRKSQLRYVSGKVIGAPPGAWLGVRHGGDSTGIALSADGSFFRTGLEPGAYTLEVRTGNQIRGRKELDLSNSDAEGVVVAADLSPPAVFSVPVQFRTEGPGPAYRPSSNAFTFLQSTDADGGSLAQPNPDGTFQFQNVSPGVYRLITFAWGDEEYYVKRILLGSQTIDGTNVDLRHGDPGGIVVVMGPKRSGIRGKLAGTRSLSQAVRVLLVDENGRTVASVNCDQTGAFRVEHVAPGRLHVYAMRDFDPDQWNRDIAKELESKSLAIELADGETKEIELPLSK